MGCPFAKPVLCLLASKYTHQWEKVMRKYIPSIIALAISLWIQIFMIPTVSDPAWLVSTMFVFTFACYGVTLYLFMKAWDK